MRRSLSVVPSAVVGLVSLSIVLGACGSSSSSVPSSTTAVSRPPAVHVLGDGVALAAAEGVAAVYGTDVVVDRSVARSPAVSWLDLRDPAAPIEGANHDALNASVLDAPSIVLLSLGADLVPPTSDPDMELCQPMTVQAAGSTMVTDCARAVLTERLLRQRTMAVAFDVLAHTRTTRVLVVGSGAAPGTIAAAVDDEMAAAVRAVADAGAAWGYRIAFAPSAADAADVVRNEGWV